MQRMTHRPLSEVQADVTKQDLEQNITELEIQSMVQEQLITDLEIEVEELKEKIGG